MTISFADPGLNLWWVIGPAGFCLVLLLVSFVLWRIGKADSSKDYELPIFIFGFVGIMVAFLGATVGGLKMGDKYADSIQARQIDALEDAGFSDVILVGDDQFTANQDGDFFRGVFDRIDSPAGTVSYRVSEVVVSK